MIFNKRDTKKAKNANKYKMKFCNVSQIVENQIDEIKQKNINEIMMMNQKKITINSKMTRFISLRNTKNELKTYRQQQ